MGWIPGTSRKGELDWQPTPSPGSVRVPWSVTGPHCDKGVEPRVTPGARLEKLLGRRVLLPRGGPEGSPDLSSVWGPKAQSSGCPGLLGRHQGCRAASSHALPTAPQGGICK